LILAAAISLTRINPDVSSALAAWGITTFFSSRALAGLKRKEERSVEARVLLRFSLILLIAGSVAASADSGFHILGYSSMTASVLGWIGLICFILGFGALFLSFLPPNLGLAMRRMTMGDFSLRSNRSMGIYGTEASRSF